MADARREYQAIFAIGGRILGSFHGAFAQAQARMARLRASGMALMTGLRRAATLAAGALGLIFGGGLLAGGMLLRRIFQNAGSEMQEAQDRARSLQAYLMLNDQIRKKGVGRAKELVGIFSQQTEALYKQGILSQDMLDNIVVGMAKARIPPAAIRDALEPMADLLAAAKGVRVTEEDATAMAYAWGKAVNTGMVRPLQQFGVFLGPDQQKAFKELVKAGNYKAAHNYLLKIAKQFKGMNKETLRAPGAAVVKFNQELDEMSERLGAHILPLQDRMARAWLKALPKIEPALIWAIKELGKAVDWTARQIEDLIDALTTAEATKAWKDLADAIRDVGRALKSAKVQPQPAPAFMDQVLRQTPLMPKPVTPAITPPMIAAPQPEPKSLATMFAELLTQKIIPEATKMLQQDARDIAAIRAEYEKFIKDMDALNAKAIVLWKQLETVPVLGPVMNYIKGFGEWVALTLTDPNKAIKLAWEDLTSSIKDTWATWSFFFQEKTNYVKTEWQRATSEVSRLWSDAIQGVRNIWQGTADLFSSTKDAIIAVFESLGKAITDFLMWPIRKVEEAWNKLTGAITSFQPTGWISGAWGAVKGAWQNRPGWMGGGGQGGPVGVAPQGLAPPNAPPPDAASLKRIQDERAALIKELQTPAMTRLLSATLAHEAGDAFTQTNALEAMVNRAASKQLAGTYRSMEDMITGGFYGPVNRGEVAASMRAGSSEARLRQVEGMVAEIAGGRNVTRGMTDQGMWNEIKGYKERIGSDYFGMMQGLPEQFQTAAFTAVPSMQEGGIAKKHGLYRLAERGSELVMPLRQLARAFSWHKPTTGPTLDDLIASTGGTSMGSMAKMGRFIGRAWATQPTTNVTFSPTITINGNATEAEQHAMDTRLRDLARDFIKQFAAAQYQERRLSYQGGYG